MAGFRTFATGEVLTAANVNNFLMKQSVMVFADADARTAALGTDVVEGMLTYNKADEELQVFDGAAFVSAAGGLVAVKSAIFTGIQSAAVTAGNNLTVTDLTITHALADAGNRLIISAFIGAAGNSNGFGTVGIAVHDGTGFIGVGDADGSRTRVTAGGRIAGTTSVANVTMPSVTFVHAPGDTTSRTLTVRAINVASATNTLFINRSEVDSDDEALPRAVSSLVIQEVRP